MKSPKNLPSLRRPEEVQSCKVRTRVNEWGQRVGVASGRDRAGTALPHEQAGRIGQAGLFTAELINPTYQALTTRLLDDEKA